MGIQRENLTIIKRFITLQLGLLVVIGYFILLGLHFVKTGGFNGFFVDLNLYYKYSLQIIQGQFPYRDFFIEYPPFALLPLLIPQFLQIGGHSIFKYAVLFIIQNILSYIVMRWQPQRSLVLTEKLYIFLTAVSGILIVLRYDMFPALLTLLTPLFILLDYPIIAGILLGCAVAAKLYPVVLLPVLIAYYLAGRKYQAMLPLLLGTFGSICLIFLPFYLLTHGEAFAFIKYHQMRGLQIESVASGLIYFCNYLLGQQDIKVTNNYGAYHIESPLADIVLKFLPLLFILGMALIFFSSLWRFRVERRTNGSIEVESLIAYIFMTLLVFMVTNKVFSSQYILWLLPFAGLLKFKQGILTLAIFILTIFNLPIWLSFDNPFPVCRDSIIEFA
jgi:uncharacterized membrane protein